MDIELWDRRMRIKFFPHGIFKSMTQIIWITVLARAILVAMPTRKIKWQLVFCCHTASFSCQMVTLKKVALGTLSCNWDILLMHFVSVKTIHLLPTEFNIRIVGYGCLYLLKFMAQAQGTLVIYPSRKSQLQTKKIKQG